MILSISDIIFADNPVTRAELSNIISLAFDLKESGEINYNDIDYSAWYYQYLKRASRYIPVYARCTCTCGQHGVKVK